VEAMMFKRECAVVRPGDAMMIRILSAMLMAIYGGSVFAGDVAVSINIGDPGFFGKIDIGDVPQPQVIYARPVVIQRAPEYISAPPIYLHVPPGHEKHWSKHCAQYNACGRPVLFVRDDWYNREYVPRYQHGHKRGEHRDEDHGHGEGHGHGHGEGHDKDHDREEGRDH
jgi:hypothetical protein